jgi:dihydrofolate reductase
VVVMSNRIFESKYGEEQASGSLKALFEKLQAEGVKKIYLDGGKLISQGLQEGLVTELILSIIPMLLGKGIPLFNKGFPESHWKLISSQAFKSGVAQLHYQRKT